MSASTRPARPNRASRAAKMMTMASPRRRKRTGGVLGTLSKKMTDPRRAGGRIEPQTREIDTDGAVLLEEVAVAEIGMERGEVGEAVSGIEVRGRINGTKEEARILLVATPEGAALLAAQIIGLHRQGRLAPEFSAAFEVRMREASGG
jgi:hypothetical protein